MAVVEGFWKKYQRSYLAGIEAAKKKEEEEKVQKALAKMKKPPKRKKGEEEEVVEEQEEISDPEYEADHDEDPQPPVNYHRKKKLRRVSKQPSKVKKDEDYLELCQKVGPVLSSLPKEHCPKVYPYLSKKYKRSLRKGVTEMFRGSLNKHMTPEEKELFRKNKDGVNMLLGDEELKCNPFDAKMAPVTRTVYGLVSEMEDTPYPGSKEDKNSVTPEEENNEWHQF